MGNGKFTISDKTVEKLDIDEKIDVILTTTTQLLKDIETVKTQLNKKKKLDSCLTVIGGAIGGALVWLGKEGVKLFAFFFL